MQAALYVSLSGQVAAEKRLASVANNVANMSTAGFRAEGVRFQEVMAKTGADAVSFASAGETYLSRKSGGLAKTGGPLDLAIQGEAYFSVMTPGGAAYTRDGRFQTTPDGRLQNMAGYDVLDAGGAPVSIQLDGGEISVGRDGSITQNGVQTGVVGVFELPADSSVSRYGNTAVLSSKPGITVQEFSRVNVRQGYSEGSNVDSMAELTRLITIQRQFDNSMSTTKEIEDTAMSAIRALGPST